MDSKGACVSGQQPLALVALLTCAPMDLMPCIRVGPTSVTTNVGMRYKVVPFSPNRQSCDVLSQARNLLCLLAIAVDGLINQQVTVGSTPCTATFEHSVQLLMIFRAITRHIWAATCASQWQGCERGPRAPLWCIQLND